jgi:hypothetical protein
MAVKGAFRMPRLQEGLGDCSSRTAELLREIWRVGRVPSLVGAAAQEKDRIAGQRRNVVICPR